MLLISCTVAVLVEYAYIISAAASMRPNSAISTTAAAALVLNGYYSLPPLSLSPPADANTLSYSMLKADCVNSAKGGKRVGSTRDCTRGQGFECTSSEPCTPCEADGGCVSCSTAPGRSRCFFLQGVGPYCLYGGNITKPCTQCCS